MEKNSMKTYVNDEEIDNPREFTMMYLNGQVNYKVKFDGVKNFKTGDRIKFVHADYIIEFEMSSGWFTGVIS